MASTTRARRDDAQALRVREIRKRLARAMPQPRCELDHRSPWQLLMATILSAQSTDRNVNRVTPELFRRWPTPAALADADRADVEEVVRSTGFFRNKARAIQESSRILAAEFDGEVPADLGALLALPGVARKTANLVMGVSFRRATGMVVDTHAARVSQRLGLTSETDPVKIEADLCRQFHKRSWIDMSHRLILHGRYVCTARRPLCDHCPLNECCPSIESRGVEPWTRRAAWESARVAARGEE